jgi:uncharacterized membrane protein
MKPARGGVGSRIGLPVLLGVILLWTVVPLAWMVLSSVKPPEDLTASTPTLAFEPTLEHYEALFSGGNDIGPYIRNSLLAAGISTVIAVVLGCLAGYGLARSRFRGKDHVAFWIISQRMAPIAAVVLPLFVIFRFTGLLGSTWGLIVAYLTFNLPFSIWIMNAFFSELSPSLEEAAMIDGASRWSAFRDVALPLVLPGIAAAAMLSLSLSSPTSHHGVLLFAMVLVQLLLLIEARRYRFFDVYRGRVRRLEKNYFAQIFAPMPDPDGGWAKVLGQDLRKPRFLIPLRVAMSRRLKRNYFWMFLVLLLAWVLKISTPKLQEEGVARELAWSVNEVVGNAAFGPLPGWVILLAVIGFYGWLAFMALSPDVETVEATYGEVHV